MELASAMAGMTPSAGSDSSRSQGFVVRATESWKRNRALRRKAADRKSTRLNSSHSQISYAVFCLKKKKTSTRDRSIRQRASVGDSRCIVEMYYVTRVSNITINHAPAENKQSMRLYIDYATVILSV